MPCNNNRITNNDYTSERGRDATPHEAAELQLSTSEQEAENDMAKNPSPVSLSSSSYHPGSVTRYGSSVCQILAQSLSYMIPATCLLSNLKRSILRQEIIHGGEQEQLLVLFRLFFMSTRKRNHLWASTASSSSTIKPKDARYISMLLEILYYWCQLRK